MQKSPSNKIVYIFLGTVIVIIAIIVVDHIRKSFSNNTAQTTEQSRPILTVKREASANKADSDGDGLQDWEELLHHTDENNSDTDGDKTSDGAEVAANRDPRKAGPNDSMDQTYDDNLFYADYKENTLTDQLSRNLASNLLNFKQADAYTPEVGDQLVNSVVTDVQKITALQDIYTSANLQTISSASPELITTYATKFATQQSAFLRATADLKNANHSTYISAVAENYKAFSRALINIQVPVTVAKAHLGIANNFYNIGIALEEINASASEPTVALMAIGKFQKIEESQPSLYLEIGTFIENNDIIFTNEEARIFWSNAISDE